MYSLHVHVHNIIHNYIYTYIQVHVHTLHVHIYYLITPQPGMKLVQALQFISWSSSIGDISLVNNYIPCVKRYRQTDG